MLGLSAILTAQALFLQSSAFEALLFTIAASSECYVKSVVSVTYRGPFCSNVHQKGFVERSFGSFILIDSDPESQLISC